MIQASAVDIEALVAALQIRSDHHTEVLIRLTKIIEDLVVRLEKIEKDHGS